MSDDTEETLEESMQETLRELREKDEPEEVEAEEVEEQPEEKPERERDEKGRFKPKEGVDPPDAAIGEEGGEAAIAPEETENADETEIQGDEAPAETVDPKLQRAPSTWTAEAKSLWNDLTPRVKQEILKREDDIGRGISQYKNDAEYGRRLNQAVQPYIPLIQAAGTSPEEAIQGSLNMIYRLSTGTPQERGQILLAAAQQFGADLSALEQGFDSGQNEIQQYLSPLQQRIQELEQSLSYQRQQSERAGLTQAEQQVENFRNATDERGNLKHTYFDDVREEMAHRVSVAAQQGRELSLDDAYDAAVWANPDTRNLMLSEQKKSEEAKRQEEAKRRAKNAKKANNVNVSSRGSHDRTTPKPTGSVDDTLKEVLAEIKSGGMD